MKFHMASVTSGNTPVITVLLGHRPVLSESYVMGLCLVAADKTGLFTDVIQIPNRPEPEDISHHEAPELMPGRHG